MKYFQVISLIWGFNVALPRINLWFFMIPKWFDEFFFMNFNFSADCYTSHPFIAHMVFNWFFLWLGFFVIICTCILYRGFERWLLFCCVNVNDDDHDWWIVKQNSFSDIVNRQSVRKTERNSGGGLFWSVVNSARASQSNENDPSSSLVRNQRDDIFNHWNG